MFFCIFEVGVLIGNMIGYEVILLEVLFYNIYYKRLVVFVGVWLIDFKSVCDNEFYFY